MITEGSAALDTIVAMRLLKLLTTPIEKSKAFKLGIVDKNGKKLRNPESSERNVNRFQ